MNYPAASLEVSGTNFLQPQQAARLLAARRENKIKEEIILNEFKNVD